MLDTNTIIFLNELLIIVRILIFTEFIAIEEDERSLVAVEQVLPLVDWVTQLLAPLVLVKFRAGVEAREKGSYFVVIQLFFNSFSCAMF